MFAITATSTSMPDPLSGLTFDDDYPEPAPGEGWQRVRVRAASLNHHDLWTLRGVGIRKDQLPIVLGCDAAGVTEDGREVIVHAVIGDADEGGGDETLDPQRTLLSEQYDGTFADWVAVPRRNLIDKPEEISFAEGACLPTAYLTVYRALFTRGGARPGDRLLVQGAGGGTTTAAILLGRAAGLRVYATSRSEEKRKQAIDLGAHEVFEAGERLPERVDLVFDSVGEATWEHSLKSLRPGGALVCVGATSGRNPETSLPHVFFRQLRVIGSTMGTRDELVALVCFLRATGLRPFIAEVFPIREGRRAFERMNEGDLFGKLVLTNE
ncbi:MAG: zinc-binding dehydrogenase [Nitriliruptorales bacterium]